MSKSPVDKANGFTPSQRRWILARDNHMCQFHYVGEDGRWHRCGVTEGLQIHHVVPRGYASMHYPINFPLNGPNNGITLCSFHHIGKGSVHPDTYEASLVYRSGDKQAYVKMMEERRSLNRRGIPYWNTMWDHMFHRILQKLNVAFLRNNPYPDSPKYGRTGRVREGD